MKNQKEENNQKGFSLMELLIVMVLTLIILGAVFSLMRGAITTANRIDHLVWWATCFPEQAGKDPAGLGPLARQLGYSGSLRESEQIVPGRAR